MGLIREDIVKKDENESAIILYDSKCGNSKSIAIGLSRGLEAGGFSVDCTSIRGYDVNQLPPYDLIGIGAPANSGKLSKQMRNFLSSLMGLKFAGKKAFVFEIKEKCLFGRSVGKRVSDHLKKVNMEIIHPVISGIPTSVEGPLEGDLQSKMEEIGLEISNKYRVEKTEREGLRVLVKWNRFKWLLVGGGPLFFFIRAIQLALTGNGCLGEMGLLFSWVLVFFEISISGVAALGGLLRWMKGNLPKRNGIWKSWFSRKFVLLSVVGTYMLHFIRVILWISFCVI
jgi:flavodoxin